MFPFACIPPKIIEYSHFPPGVTKGELQALGGMQAKVLFTRLHKELQVGGNAGCRHLALIGSILTSGHSI